MNKQQKEQVVTEEKAQGERRRHEQWHNASLKAVGKRVLRVVDATIPQAVQNEAVRHLIAQEFQEEFNHVFNLYHSDIEEASEEASGEGPIIPSLLRE